MTSYGSDFVREARKRVGWTQRELAAKAGTTQSAIALWSLDAPGRRSRK